MDEVTRLITAFGSRGKRDQSLWKLDVLMDLGRLEDPRVRAFLTALVTDDAEPLDVRADALRRLREASLAPHERAQVAAAALQALAPVTPSDLRQRAAVVLGDFVDEPGVLESLGATVANPLEPLEIRYDAFMSLQRAGPSVACLTILRSLATDETFGQSARALLTAWRAD